MSIQQMLEIGLPCIAALISYGIQQAHWSARVNTTIAGVSVLLAALASAFLQGQLTGNVYADALLVLSTAIALQSKAFAPLQQYLLANFTVKSQPVQPEPVQLQTPPTAKDLTSGK